jgi:hypothetical protein
LNLNYQNFWIFKIFSTSHDFKLIWTRQNDEFISTPNIAYSYHLFYSVTSEYSNQQL